MAGRSPALLLCRLLSRLLLSLPDQPSLLSPGAGLLRLFYAGAVLRLLALQRFRVLSDARRFPFAAANIARRRSRAAPVFLISRACRRRELEPRRARHVPTAISDKLDRNSDKLLGMIALGSIGGLAHSGLFAHTHPARARRQPALKETL